MHNNKLFDFEAQRRAEWLGNDNRKTMIKAITTGQIPPFKSGTALPSPSQALGSAFLGFSIIFRTMR